MHLMKRSEGESAKGQKKKPEYVATVNYFFSSVLNPNDALPQSCPRFFCKKIAWMFWSLIEAAA